MLFLEKNNIDLNGPGFNSLNPFFYSLYCLCGSFEKAQRGILEVRLRMCVMCLGLRNPRSSLTLLDNDEKNTVRIMDANKGNPMKTIVNDQGLYQLIFKSRKPQAKAFNQHIVKQNCTE